MQTANILCAAAFAALFFGFHRRFGKRYLLSWSWSWLGATIAALTEATSTTSAGWPLTVKILGGAAVGLQHVWLMLACYEIAHHRSARLRAVRIVVPTAAIGLALISTTIAAPLSKSLIEYVCAGTTAIGAAWILRRRGSRGTAGVTLFALLLIGLSVLRLLSGWTLVLHEAPITSLTLALFGGQIALGLIMIAAFLDDEREAAVLAASEIEHLAYNDALTGLPNRSLFFDRVIVALAQATRQHHNVAILFLDIDRFKLINDSLGHTFGDGLLKATASRLSDCVRPGDTVARFGGDEFTILLPQVDKVGEAAIVAQRILAAVRQPFHLAGRELNVSTSIGISFYPADGLDADTLVKNADIAMYRAKEQGRDNFQLFTPELTGGALERLDLENRLRRAVVNGELLLHYQPIIHVEKSTVYGFEALLRWRHPELGLLAPAHFIDAAEISGLTVSIGEWALRQACIAARRWWVDSGVQLAVSVNVSARQLHEPELVSHVREALRESGLPPQLLDLEITETNAMRNPEATLRVLQQLKGLGVHVSMDDFGTGYSSLSYLRRFPIDTLKLDRSFVRDIQRTDYSAISIAVIEMAKALGMKIVAEGVETEQQMDFLRRHGCDFAQGYFFAQPLSEPDCREFILRNTVPNQATGPVQVQRLRLKQAIPVESTPPEELHPIIQVRTKSGSIKKAELKDPYGPRPDLINDN